jgi:asparagine synthase (glutamine-hydrolysing)
MSVTPGEIDSHRWFDPNDPPGSPRKASLETTINRTRELVVQAVRRQLVSDVPLGCFLSGGIDSSIIAAAMRQGVPPDQPVLTFSIGFEDKRYDETRFAAAVARHLGTEHRAFTVKPSAVEDLPKLASVFGEPFGDSSALPTHYLSRETRRHVKVALSGDGGDELFGGYDRYRAMELSQRLQGFPLGLLRLAHLTGRLERLGGADGKSPMTRLRRFAAGLDLPPAQRYASYLRIFDEGTLRELIKGDLLREGDELHCSEYAMGEHFDELLGRSRDRHVERDVVQAALAVDRIFYLPEDLLTKVDRCSMLHALEVRSPFMDHELVHFASGLRTSSA